MVLWCSVRGWERCSESALQRGEERRGTGPLQQQQHRDGAISSQCRFGEVQDLLPELPAQTVPPQSLLTLFFVNPFTLFFVCFFLKATIFFFHCCWRRIFKYQDFICDCSGVGFPREIRLTEKHSNLEK